LAELIGDALRGEPSAVAPRTTQLRQRFRSLHYINQ
jgi:hypothetical protein